MQSCTALLIACCAPLLIAESGTSLYSRSLTACVEARRQEDRTTGSVVVLRNLITEKGLFLYPPPTDVGSIRVEYLDSQALRQRLQVARSLLPVIEINPILNDGPFLIVDCSEFDVFMKKRELVKWFKGGIRVRWRLDAETQDYSLVSVLPYPPL